MANEQVHSILLTVPFVVGAVLCGMAGICTMVYLVCVMLDWMADRFARTFNLYHEFLAFIRHRAVEKRKREDAEKTS